MLRPPTHGARASVPRANAAACRTGTPWEEEPSPLALSQVGSVQSRGLGFFWAGVVRRHHRLQTAVLRSMHNCVIRYKCPPHRTVSCKCGSKMLMVRLENDVSLAHSVPLQARSQQMFCLQNTQRVVCAEGNGSGPRGRKQETTFGYWVSFWSHKVAFEAEH